jgi:hypothetical protein
MDVIKMHESIFVRCVFLFNQNVTDLIISISKSVFGIYACLHAYTSDGESTPTETPAAQSADTADTASPAGDTESGDPGEAGCSASYILW